MRAMKRIVTLGILGLAVLVSCSVKEDRADCPCWLTVRASYPNEVVSAWFGTHTLFEGLVGEQIDRQVPRGTVDLVASRGKFTVAPGQQMDELYATALQVDTQCEEAEAIPFLNKQFARIYLEFKEADEGRLNITMEVAGNVKGADKRTLAPVQGAFSCTPEDNPDGGYVFRAPRQKDNSLILNRWSADGEELPPILLGQLIQKAGFDWTAESLGDVSILADLPAQTFQITVQDWYGPVTMTVTY